MRKRGPPPARWMQVRRICVSGFANVAGTDRHAQDVPQPMTSRRALRPFLLLLSVIAVSLAGPAIVGAASVTIVNTGAQTFDFRPGTVTIYVGESVTWTNRSNTGSEPHTVTADNGAFGSGI